LEKKIEQEIKTEIESVLKDNDVPLEDIFNYNYHELTPQLKEQLEEAQLFFENLKKEKQ
jgi:pyruvate dehydrogenase E1 component alpha subunit